MEDLLFIMIGFGLLLIVVLLVLLVAWAFKEPSRRPPSRVRDDIRKIKNQIR